MGVIKIGAGIGALVLLTVVFSILPASDTHAPDSMHAPQQEVRILFVGDMFFDRHIRRVTEQQGHDLPFSCVQELFSDADLVVGNLEGPITAHESVSINTKPGEPDNYRFTFPVETAEALKRNGVDIVSLGNNHIGNFGIEGMHATRVYLDAAHVAHFGGLAGDEPILRIQAHGIPLSFVSYNQFGGNDPEAVAEAVHIEKNQGRMVIVYAHWGEEYVPPGTHMRETATLFAEAGAIVIIGSHPHVVLESGYIGPTLVYYSLGNFIFDQYKRKETTEGLAVMLTLPPQPDGTITVNEHPVILTYDGRTCLKP